MTSINKNTLTPAQQWEQTKDNESKYLASIQDDFVSRFKTFCSSKELLINEFIYVFYVPNARYFNQHFFQWYNECLAASSNQDVITFLMLLLLNDAYLNFLKTMKVVAWDGNYDASKDVFVMHVKAILIMYEYFYRLINKFRKAIGQKQYQIISVGEKLALYDVLQKYETQTCNYMRAILYLMDPTDSMFNTLMENLNQ